MLLEHMHKKFQINRTKIKGGCQSARKVVAYNSKSDFPLVLAAHSIHESGFNAGVYSPESPKIN